MRTRFDVNDPTAEAAAIVKSFVNVVMMLIVLPTRC